MFEDAIRAAIAYKEQSPDLVDQLMAELERLNAAPHDSLLEDAGDDTPDRKSSVGNARPSHSAGDRH